MKGNPRDDKNEIVAALLKEMQQSGVVLKETSEGMSKQIGEGVDRGIEDSVKRIESSSVKITKAFRDLAKKITNQKDIFSVSLGSQNIALDIDFSDVDINSEDFKRRVDEAFEKFKIDNAIKFDSKAAEKQFKDMLGLHIKYAEKLSNLQAQAAKPIKTSTKGKNAQSQLAVMSGLEDIQNKINQAAGKPVKMPRVYLEDSNVLKDRVHSMETELKVEEKVAKQRDTNADKRSKEVATLKNSNEEIMKFALQFGSLQKEMGASDKFTANWNNFLEQVQKGALTAAQAIAELREEMTKTTVAAPDDAPLGDYSSPSREKPVEMGKWKKANFFSTIRGKDGKLQAVAREGRTDGNYNYFKDEITKQWRVIDKITGLSTGEVYKTYKEAQEDTYNQQVQEALAKIKYDTKIAQAAIAAMREAEASVGISSSSDAKTEAIVKQKKIAEETANIEAKADGQSVVAEQTELDLTEEELKVEKEITAENEKQAASAERLKEIKKGMSMAEFNATHYDKNIDFNQDVATSNKSELLSYLGDNPEQTENELKLWKQQIENRIKPVNETVSRISKMSAVPKELNTTKLLYQEAAKVGQQIQTMYDGGITDTEEYIALQYKLLKIFDKIAYAYGGVKGSGAKDRTELNQWMYNALKEDTGFDFYGGSLVDALYSGQNSIYDDKGKKLSMKDKVANLLNYDSGSFTGAFGFDQDLQDLQEINTLLDIIEKRRSELFNKSESTNSDVKPNFIKTNDTPNKFKTDQGVQTSMDDMLPASAEDIAPKVESEVKGLDKVGEAAERTAESKNKLADASKKVTASVIETDDEGGKNIWTTSRSGESLDTLNLPVRYVGENGQNAVQMFAGLKSQIEEMTGKPVIIEFASNVNENGELEAIGATLKYVNEEAGVTVKQFYDIERGEGDMLIATQSYEKATLSKTKAAKAFNTEMQRKLAEEQVKTLESRMGTLKDSTGDFTQALQDARTAAANINGKAGLEDFNLKLRVANEKSKQLKSELKGQNTLDTIASMERRLLTLPNKIDEVQRKLNNLGNTEGADYVDDVIRSIQDEYQRFLTTDNAEEKASLFSSLISSMTWVDSELTALSNRQKEIKAQETAVEKEELAKQKAARESYINWWKSTLEKQEKEEKPYRDYGKTTANSAVRKRDNLQGEIDALGVTNPEILAQIDAYKDKVRQVVDLREKFAKDPNAAKNPELVGEFQKISAEAERARKSIKSVIDEEQKMARMSEEQGFSPVELSVDQIANLKNTMIDYAKSTKQGRVEIKGWNDDNTKMYYTVTNSKGAVEEMTMAIGQGTNKMYQYRTATKKTGTLFQQVFKGIKVKAKELLSFVIGGGSIYKVISIFRQGIQYVREIDLALTELKKVTDETEESYDRFLDTAAKTGAKLGTTISAVTEATATFAKLGYSMEQATKMAESAIVYKNVGDNIASTEDAANSIISTMKGFRLEASESMAIVDRFNEVGNRFAITSQGIGEALRLSASALSEGGNSLDESIGLITAANEVVNDPSSVGTALKTLTLRLRGSKTELEEMGEDVSDMATTTSQLQAKLLALTGGQVDIMLDTNTFKNSTQILREMAEAWEDMNDIQRASALELMGGKRQANVLSALIQNFDTVEKVIETSEDSAGSALKENERYLDSIQGKIDQFNNSVQSLWSNILDDDFIKTIVSWVTEIIKSLDTTKGKLLALVKVVALLMAYKKVNPLDWVQKIGSFFATVKDTGIKQWLASLLGIAPAMKVVTAETIANTVATQMNDAAKAKQMLSEMGLSAATGSLSAAQKEQAATAILNAMSTGQLTMAQGNAMLAMLGYSGATMAADGSLKVLDTTTKSFMASNPIGWILAIISAVVVLVTLLSKIPSDVEDLENKMSDLSSEISNLESEIDSLNSELKTTQDRIAELVAMPSLSFVEQEELRKLQLQNAELEKNIQLKQLLLDSKQNENIKLSKEWIDGVWNGKATDLKYALFGNDGANFIGEDEWLTSGMSGKEVLNTALPDYKNKLVETKEIEAAYISAKKELTEQGKLSLDTFKKVIELNPNKTADAESFYKQSFRASDEDLTNDLKVVLDQNESTIGKMEDGIQMVLGDMSKIIETNNLSYSMGDEEINKFLDEYYAYQYKWQEAQGISAKSSAIASIFDDTSSSGIKKLKEDLTAIAGDDTLDAAKRQEKALNLVKETLKDTSGEYDRLKTSMDIIGITADEVARYFVQLSGAPDSSTVEGLTAQYQKGVEALSKYQGLATDIISEFTNLDGSVEQITWGSLFDDKGETIDTQISKVLQGADETARTEFARIAKAVNEGKMSVDNAMKSFSVSGVQAGYKLLENAVVEINSDIFKDLGDEISGLIDTFDEFGSALESVANSIELVNQAQAEMAYSGHVSVETALDLINSTEDWNKVLKVENGNITLVDGAMDILAQSKLDQIKTNLQLALSEAQAGLEQARLAESSGEVAKTLEESTTESVRQLAANMEYLSTLIGEFLAGNFLGAGSAAKAAKESSLASTEYQKSSTTSSMSVADWEEKVANIEAKLGILEGVDTPEEFGNNYSSEEVSGGNSTKDEVEDDRFQKEMDYWENRLSANQARADRLENTIDLLEQKGMKASAQYYRDQMTLLNSVDPNDGVDSKLELLNGKLAAVVSRLKETTDGSEEWWEAAQEYNDIVNEIQEIESAIVDMQDAIAEIDTYKFEEFNTRLDSLTSKLETIRNLIAPNGEEDWFDDEGNWTEAGVAYLATYIQDLADFNEGLTRAKEEYTKYTKEYAGNEDDYANLGIHSEQELYDKREELIEQQYDYAESINDTEQSVVDMYESNIDAIEEYTETLIDSYNDYIDSVKEALSAEKDLYEFKKNVQKQSEDINELERKISALSGSTNKSEIAERRKLEAQLYEAREGLNDTYYDHVQNSQDAALDAEQSAYEETMNKFIEGMRTSLETATQDMNTFLGDVTTMVSLNAGTILEQYRQTKLPLDDALTSPWEAAKKAVGNYSGDALELMNTWTQNGFLTDFPNTVQNSLESPWKAGQTAVGAFKTSVDTQMQNVVSAIETNVKNASTKLSELYKQIKDTENRAANVNIDPSTDSDGDGGGDQTASVGAGAILGATVALRGLMKTSKEMILGSKSFVDANTETINGVKYYRDSKTGYYYKISDLNSRRKYDGGRTTGWAIPKGTWFYTKHAKGTTGVPDDELAIVDEFGPELILHADPTTGRLQYLTKGTGVIPSELTEELMELGKIGVDGLMNTNKFGANINMISNAINKPEIVIDVENFLKVDRVDKDSLPQLEAMMDKKIDTFAKQLNYSIKKFSR